MRATRGPRRRDRSSPRCPRASRVPGGRPAGARPPPGRPRCAASAARAARRGRRCSGRRAAAVAPSSLPTMPITSAPTSPASSTALTRLMLMLCSREPPPTENTRMASRVVQPRSDEPVPVGRVPALVVDPRRQLRDVVARGVALDVADLAEVVDRVRRVARAAAGAEDEEPPAARAHLGEGLGDRVDGVGVEGVRDLGDLPQVLGGEGRPSEPRGGHGAEPIRAARPAPGGGVVSRPVPEAQRIVVVGGTGGLGSAVVEALLARGDRVLATGRDPGRLEALRRARRGGAAARPRRPGVRRGPRGGRARGAGRRAGRPGARRRAARADRPHADGRPGRPGEDPRRARPRRAARHPGLRAAARRRRRRRRSSSSRAAARPAPSRATRPTRWRRSPRCGWPRTWPPRSRAGG